MDDKPTETSQTPIEYKVKFIPKLKYVDDIFLGNLLTEVLGELSTTTHAFDFRLERADKTGTTSGKNVGQ